MYTKLTLLTNVGLAGEIEISNITLDKRMNNKPEDIFDTEFDRILV